MSFVQPEHDEHVRPWNVVPRVSLLVISHGNAKYFLLFIEIARREDKLIHNEFVLIADCFSDDFDRARSGFVVKHHGAICSWQEHRGICATCNEISVHASGVWGRYFDGDEPLMARSTRHLSEVDGNTGAEVVYGKVLSCGLAPLLENQEATMLTAPGLSAVHTDGATHLIKNMNFTPSMSIHRRDALSEALPLPPDLISCRDHAQLFPVIHHASRAWGDEAICYSLNGARNQLSANQTHHSLFMSPAFSHDCPAHQTKNSRRQRKS